MCDRGIITLVFPVPDKNTWIATKYEISPRRAKEKSDPEHLSNPPDAADFRPCRLWRDPQGDRGDGQSGCASTCR